MTCFKQINEDIGILKAVFNSDHECFQYIENSKSYLRMRFIVNADESFTFSVSLPFDYPKVKPVWFVENPTKSVLIILRDLAEEKKTDDMTLITQVNILLKELGELFKMQVDKFIDQLDAAVLNDELRSLVLNTCECPICVKENMLLGACGYSSDADSGDKTNDSTDGSGENSENPSEDDDDLKENSKEKKFSYPIHVKKEGVTNRLMRELRDFYRSDSYAKGFFDIDLVNDSLYEWKVDLFCIDPSSMLANDLASLKRKGNDGFIKLHMHFSKNYPYEPPFVRIVYPHITGGFVMAGGVFCIELLSAKGWRSAYSVESVLVQIGAALGNANARTSKNAVKLAEEEYTLENAQSVYKTIENYHNRMGWRNRKDKS